MNRSFIHQRERQILNLNLINGNRKFTLVKVLALHVVLSIAVVSLTACGNEKSVTYSSGGMTNTFNEGEKGIPKDLQSLVYPGAEIAGSTSAQDKDGEHSAFVSLSTPDSLERVSAWYDDSLKKNGWSIDSHDATQPSFVSISGHQKDVEINVIVAQDANKTTISVSEGKSGEGDPVDDDEIERFEPNANVPPTE
jgi:hypothetical protein